VNIIDAIRDRNVFGQHFKADTWTAWLAFLCALFALPMTGEQLALYRKHTGRVVPPCTPLQEAWLCCGRRSGKSFMLATVAVFLASFKDWRPFLGPGEVGTIAVIAADRKQSRTILRYITGLLKAVPMLRQLIVGETMESVKLRNRVVIEIHTASFKTTRGYTICAALLDEIAFFAVDEFSASPDVETINAIRPGMATVPGAIML
jgi:phage terminase large subunit-like protein